MRTFILFIIIISSSVRSEEVLNISFGEELPPWISFTKEKGIIYNIIKDCLKGSNIKIKPIYVPYSRRLPEYQGGRASAVSDISPNMIKTFKLKGYYTGELYSYENFAYTLKSNKIKLEKISDLSQYSLISWQGAIEHLGGEYAAMAKANSRYHEISSQKTQVKMLYLNRYQVVQMDSQIFEYYKEMIEKEGDINTSLEIERFPLFGKSRNGVLFKSKKLRDYCVNNLKK
ncbi:hypothetical protein [Halobacteriovorax sp.]|uniref:hypothetical protein n=1 Tax=Halobacteriovorax sp. TaxID=2020862 RepID=UPI0035638679